MSTLHLICGLPGSGKSTLAEKLERELPALRLTPDIWIKIMNKKSTSQSVFYGSFDLERNVDTNQWSIVKFRNLD